MSFSGVEKTAIFIMALNEDIARDIVNNLEHDELNAISIAMTKLGDVDSETVEKVLIEFVHDLNQSLKIVGNSRTTQLFLHKILDEQKFNSVVEKIKGANTHTVWEMITNFDDSAVAQFIKHECPQTSALIMSKIPGEKSARILKMLSKEYAAEVLKRMMYLDKVKIETLQGLERVLESQLLDLSSVFNVAENSHIVANIFDSFNKNDEEYFMNILKDADPKAAKQVSKAMLSFDDLIFIQDNGIEILMKKIDNTTLVTALSGASNEIKQLFLENMSQRVARMIDDEINSNTRHSKKEVITAQVKILKTTKAMISDGTIIIEKNLTSKLDG